MKAGTQPERLYRYLQSHPGASSREINHALDITNATGRISDLRAILRAQGGDVVKEKRSDGRDGYRLMEQPVQRDLGLDAA